MSLALHFGFLAASQGRANPIVSVIVGLLVIAAVIALYFEMNGNK